MTDVRIDNKDAVICCLLAAKSVFLVHTEKHTEKYTEKYTQKCAEKYTEK